MNRTTQTIIGQSQVESNAINSHLEVLPKLIETIQAFDGKVVNVRLFNALTEAAGQSVYKEMNYRSELSGFTIRYDKPIQVNTWIYPQWHRTCEIPLVFQEDGKRLDATGTIHNIHTKTLYLNAKLKTYDITETEIESAQVDVEALKAQLRELIAEQDNDFLKESLRDALKYIG